ncbi:hypothetical protein AB3S75_006004 [Citrus x aurantiifolia]
MHMHRWCQVCVSPASQSVSRAKPNVSDPKKDTYSNTSSLFFILSLYNLPCSLCTKHTKPATWFSNNCGQRELILIGGFSHMIELYVYQKLDERI